MIHDTILLIGGAAVVFVAIALWCQSLYRVLAYRRAIGHVTGYRREDDCYFAKLEFVIESGEIVACVSDVGRGVKEYTTGTEVRVLYNPSKPSEATVYSFSSLWAAPIIATSIASVFLFFIIKEWAKYFHG